MKKIDPCALYLRQVGRRLRCPKAERKQLLAEVAAEIEDAFSVEGELSIAAITAKFGQPEDLATDLELLVPQEVQDRATRCRRRGIFVGFGACILVIGLLVGYLAWLASIDIHYIDTEVVVETRYIGN